MSRWCHPVHGGVVVPLPVRPAKPVIPHPDDDEWEFDEDEEEAA